MSVRNVALVVLAALAGAAVLIYFGKDMFSDETSAANQETAYEKPPANDAMTLTPQAPPVGLRPLEPASPSGLQAFPIEVVAPEPEPFKPPPFKKGDLAIVTSAIYEVTVMNPRPIWAGANRFMFGEVCDIAYRGTLSVVGLDGDEALVRYRHDHYDRQSLPTGNRPRRGAIDGIPSACPSGTLFFIDRSKYLDRTVPSRIAAVKDLLRKERAAKK